MDVILESIVFPPNYQHHLRVGLIVDDAVHHVSAGLLQAGGEGDVGFFIEAGAQFHHYAHLFSRPCRGHQCVDDRRTRVGAIKRLLDGQYLRVRRCLPHEVYDDGKGFEGVMQQDVMCAYRREYVVTAGKPCR